MQAASNGMRRRKAPKGKPPSPLEFTRSVFCARGVHQMARRNVGHAAAPLLGPLRVHVPRVLQRRIRGVSRGPASLSHRGPYSIRATQAFLTCVFFRCVHPITPSLVFFVVVVIVFAYKSRFFRVFVTAACVSRRVRQRGGWQERFTKLLSFIQTFLLPLSRSFAVCCPSWATRL